MTKNIGKFLQEVRKSKGLTQKELTVNEFLSGEKILPENYSMKAEENIMALIEENKRTQKGNIISRIIGGVVVLISLLFMFISNAGGLSPINNFIDFISLITVVLLEIGVILISGARTKETILKLLSRTILLVGLMCSIVSVIIILIYVMDGNAMALRVNLAVAVLALLYSVVIKIVVEIMLVKEG